MPVSKQGQYLQADFFDNVGGLNISDSPWRVNDSQATGGQNYEYSLTGGFRKIKGKTKINSSAFTALRTTGTAQHVTNSGTKTHIRCADRKVQKLDTSVPSVTNLSEDTAGAGTDILAASNTIPVVFSQFNTSTNATLWMAGGGMSLPYAVYSTTKVTKNGADVATGSFTAPVSLTGGNWTSAGGVGTYYYAITLVKASTGTESNAGLDLSAVIANNTDKVTLDFTTLTSLDATKYSHIKIYRSAVGGASAFTTGSLVTTITTATTSYVDTGSASLTAQNVPRVNSLITDNSVLPSGTYKTLTTWKRRLVTTSGSTVYLSDVNKPESWPTVNYINIPSGGPVLSASIISFTTPTSQSIDEILVLHKERELWVITGNTYTDFSLKFIDNVGCISQTLVAGANGYLGWVDYRGIYLWDGSGKPIYASRPIEPLFSDDDQLDKSKFSVGFSFYKRATSEIMWVLSDAVNGENKIAIKMDLRLTIPNIQSQLSGRVLDGTFIVDVLPTALYAGASLIPTTEEQWFVGDSAGYMYTMFDAFTDASAAIDFKYETKFFDLGSVNTTKRFHKIIVWTQDTTDADITLDFWTKYNSGEDDKSTQSAPISLQVSEALWDLAYWDSAYWDNTILAYNPVVFNLQSSKNSIEGDCIKLRFKQNEANALCTVAGFSILYTELGLRK